MLIAYTGSATERLRVREIHDEGQPAGVDCAPGQRAAGDLIWRDNHAYDERLHRLVTRANVICHDTSFVMSVSGVRPGLSRLLHALGFGLPFARPF